MKARPIEDMVKALKEIVDKNGPNYLAEEPFQVYTELIRSGNPNGKPRQRFLFLSHYSIQKPRLLPRHGNHYRSQNKKNSASRRETHTPSPPSAFFF